MRSIWPSNLYSAQKKLIKTSLSKRINTLDQVIYLILTLLVRMRLSVMAACRWYRECKRCIVKTKSFKLGTEWGAKQALSYLRVELISSMWPVTWINMSALRLKTVWHLLSNYTRQSTIHSISGPRRKRWRGPVSMSTEVNSILSMKLRNGNNLWVTSANITTNSSKISLVRVWREETSIYPSWAITSNKKCLALTTTPMHMFLAAMTRLLTQLWVANAN